MNHEKVSFNNRLGIKLVADLYVPKNLDRKKRAPAIVVGHPYGGVKEQTSGLYAQTMAERGFITLAFDASYNGESGGQPHFIASPEAFVEDFSAAVDYLGANPLVDRNRIGVIGVCGYETAGLVQPFRLTSPLTPLSPATGPHHSSSYHLPVHGDE